MCYDSSRGISGILMEKGYILKMMAYFILFYNNIREALTVNMQSSWVSNGDGVNREDGMLLKHATLSIQTLERGPYMCSG